MLCNVHKGPIMRIPGKIIEHFATVPHFKNAAKEFSCLASLAKAIEYGRLALWPRC